MSVIESAIRRAAVQARCALIAYITAGDPSLDETVELACTIADAGADVIELGIPFSDPVADGPTIQASSFRALAAGATVAGVLDAVRRIRARSSIPVVAMTYWNPVLQFGIKRFVAEAGASGVNGTIVTDLPPEEAVGPAGSCRPLVPSVPFVPFAGPTPAAERQDANWVAASRSAGLDTIFLVTPASSEARIRLACRLATGFVYCVSRLGVTGEREDLPPDIGGLITRAKAETKRPVCVGFGISEPDHVHALAPHADGVVIGSALVGAAAAASDADRLSVVARLVAEWRSAAARRRRDGGATFRDATERRSAVACCDRG